MVSEVISVCYNNVKFFVKKKWCVIVDVGVFDNKLVKGVIILISFIVVWILSNCIEKRY